MIPKHVLDAIETLACFVLDEIDVQRDALAAAARKGGDVKQAPAESPQSGPPKEGNAQ